MVNVVGPVKPTSVGTRLKQNVEPTMLDVVVVMTRLVIVLVEKKMRPIVLTWLKEESILLPITVELKPRRKIKII
ncbi:hypothetical protein QYM36_001094 [Artemia franciscana]|uniref:Uncharacterized protein n=1 Tax=Artemia franciscana TaxID=6661 RepID=A0AA88I9N7_ARTSF|nr:hypothetical protein QYM36_001094 [Artemia franciscana]